MSKEERTSIESTLAVLVSKMERMELDISEIKESLKKEYVTTQEFQPVKNVVYGLVATVLLSIIGALTSFFIKK